MTSALHLTYKLARRIVIGIIGSSVVLLGVIMLVTPGPAVVVIPAGLAILGLEFAWARRWLRRIKQGASRVWDDQKNKAAKQTYGNTYKDR